MPHRPPLTADQLAQIYDDYPMPVVADLLWEIHRLRETIRRADQIRKMIKTAPVGVPIIVWELFEKELDAEPCLTDRPTPRKKVGLDRLDALADARAEKRRRTGRWEVG
jgi:hypothetical protein